jgi:hypothetical protein
MNEYTCIAQKNHFVSLTGFKNVMNTIKAAREFGFTEKFEIHYIVSHEKINYLHTLFFIGKNNEINGRIKSFMPYERELSPPLNIIAHRHCNMTHCSDPYQPLPL